MMSSPHHIDLLSQPIPIMVGGMRAARDMSSRHPCAIISIKPPPQDGAADPQLRIARSDEAKTANAHLSLTSWLRRKSYAIFSKGLLKTRSIGRHYLPIFVRLSLACRVHDGFWVSVHDRVELLEAQRWREQDRHK